MALSIVLVSLFSYDEGCVYYSDALGINPAVYSPGFPFHHSYHGRYILAGIARFFSSQTERSA